MPAPRPAVMSPDELAMIGQEFYGEHWQTPMARDLDVSPRSLRYMLSTDPATARAIHAGIVRDLIEIGLQRQGEIGRALETLQEKLHHAAKVPAGASKLAPTGVPVGRLIRTANR